MYKGKKAKKGTNKTTVKQNEKQPERFEQSRQTKNRIKKHLLIINDTFAAEFKTKVYF